MSEEMQQMRSGAARGVVRSDDDDDSCPNTCEGTGSEKTKEVAGMCPDGGCDQEVFKSLERDAKASARDAAMKVCLGSHRDCVCVEGKYTVVTKECTSTQRGQHGDWYCIYVLSY